MKAITQASSAVRACPQGLVQIADGRCVANRVANPFGALTSQAKTSAAESADEFRVELLMALDLFVRAQHSLRAESSTFTRSLGRVPDVLGSLTHYYRIDIARATRDRLLVVAIGEGRRNAMTASSVLVGDRLAIDEDFKVRSNFPVPTPPRDYLHTLARTVMNRIFANQFQIPERSELDKWEGVFRGNFKYEVRPVSQGGRTIVAVGLHPPVQDDIVEMQTGADLYEWVYQHRHTSWVEREMYGPLEKIYLAERIHLDHTGSFSPTFKGLLPNWSEISGLAVEQSGLVVQDFQLDPTFGFHAELTLRQSRLDSGATVMHGRAMAVNGYGQISEVSTIEGIVSQFEQARRKVAAHGDIQPGDPRSDALQIEIQKEELGERDISSADLTRAAEVISNVPDHPAQNAIPARTPPPEPLKEVPRESSERLLQQELRDTENTEGRTPLLIDPVDGDK